MNKTEIKSLEEFNAGFMRRLQNGKSSAPEIKLPKKKKKGTIIRAVIVNTLFFSFLAFVLAIAVLMNLNENKSLFGYSVANAVTFTAQPEIPEGSMLLIKETDPGILRVGDDISYMADAVTNATRRISAITENYENTGARGFELNGGDDGAPGSETVYAANVLGRVVWHIPFAGGALARIGGHPILSAGFSAGFIVLLILLYGILKNRAYEKKRNFVLIDKNMYYCR